MSRVLVLGNAGMDVTLGMARVPAPGETLVATTVRRAPGGKGLNQAVTAARAGAEVLFQAPIGGDADAALLEDVLSWEPLRFLPCRVSEPTDLSVIMVTPGGENCIATAGLAADAIPVAVAAAFGAEVGPEDWLLVQGNLSLAATQAAMRAARGRVILNTAPLRWPVMELLPFCHLVIANQVEAEQIAGLPAEQAAIRLLEAGARAAVVTLGGAGAMLAEPAALHHLSATPVPVVDSTGAGDTLCGVLAAALARGMDLDAALPAAQHAAARTVTRPGAFAALPDREELAAILYARA